MKKILIVLITLAILFVLGVGVFAWWYGKEKSKEPSNAPIARTSENISWDEATQLIKDCKVNSAYQTHALIVTLTLKDGSSKVTQEPAIDEVFKVTDQARQNCGAITEATE